MKTIVAGPLFLCRIIITSKLAYRLELACRDRDVFGMPRRRLADFGILISFHNNTTNCTCTQKCQDEEDEDVAVDHLEAGTC